MIALNLTASTEVSEILNSVMRLTLRERLLVARYLLDTVLTKDLTEEIDEDTTWLNLSLSAFEKEWDNEEDAIFDNWKELYGVPTR